MRTSTSPEIQGVRPAPITLYVAQNRPTALRSTAVIAVALVISTGLSACARRSDPVSRLVLGSWTLTAKSGHIACECFGSWEECGALTNSYPNAHALFTPASEAIRRQLRSKGWTIEHTKDDGSQLSAC